MEKWYSSGIKIGTMLNNATGNMHKFVTHTWNPTITDINIVIYATSKQT